MRRATDAIVLGVLITLLGFHSLAMTQPATEPLILLEPEKPIDASRDAITETPESEPPEPEPPIEERLIEEDAEEDAIDPDSLTPGSVSPDLINPDSSLDRPDEETPNELEESDPEESDEIDASDTTSDTTEESSPPAETDSETLEAAPETDDLEIAPETDSSASTTLPIPPNCEPLPLVGGQGSEVTKRTSPPGFSLPLPLPGPIPDPRFRSNWNTDWYIPNAQDFRRYVVVLLPHNNADYSIEMYLKYPDDTAEEFYEEQDIRLTANEPLIIETEPRSDLPPYQINANIGGILSIGVRYTIAVAGCR